MFIAGSNVGAAQGRPRVGILLVPSRSRGRHRHLCPGLWFDARLRFVVLIKGVFLLMMFCK